MSARTDGCPAFPMQDPQAVHAVAAAAVIDITDSEERDRVYIKARAGWVVSNPLYDRSLSDHPENDPSLPGPMWLWEVYRSHRNRALVLLPRCFWATELRAEPVRAAEQQEEPAPRVGQMDLFREAA